MSKPHRIPPTPGVMAMLFMEYRRSKKSKSLSFKKYLASIGFIDPAADIDGMDDAIRHRVGAQRIALPSRPIAGKMRVKVLLVDFPDKPGTLPLQHYEDMLFSSGEYPVGSMRDYYKEVSRDKVNVEGSVHGWLRLPNPYTYYTNNESGMGARSYPHNAQKMAEDAVHAALKSGVVFDKGLDKLNQGIVTALFIIHAGRGAESLHPTLAGKQIWSHKWEMRHPVNVGGDLYANIYLTVPHDCKVGVCAHELGHLAFQWEDFYDPNYDEDGKEWDGSGAWDLMAGGSWNGDGARPAHPAALHKMQHGWLPVTTVKKSRKLTIKPYSTRSGRVYKIVSPVFEKNQYLLLENRKRQGFDFSLPGEGLLVWRVDEKGAMEAPDKPALLLIQADGKHDLEKPKDWNDGDAGDPFPGKSRRKTLKDSGSICTSFPKAKRSGVILENIVLDHTNGAVTLNVKIKSVAAAKTKSTVKRASVAVKKTKKKKMRGRSS